MKSIVKETLAHWRSHNAPRMGAALSYYAMLSFIPLLFLLVLLASSIFNTDLVQGTLVIEIGNIIGRNAAEYIEGILRTKAIQDATLVTAIVSAGITLFGAVGVFGELDQDFDTLWDTPKERASHKSTMAAVWAFVHKKLVAFSFVPLLVILILVVIAISVLFGVLEHGSLIHPTFALIAQFVGPLVLSTALFATIYRILPNRKLPWCVLWIGALVTTLLFGIGNFLVVEYISLIVHTDVFGGAASLVGLLVWIYYSAQVFFLGVSFTYIYAKRKGFIAPFDERVQ